MKTHMNKIRFSLVSFATASVGCGAPVSDTVVKRVIQYSVTADPALSGNDGIRVSYRFANGDSGTQAVAPAPISGAFNVASETVGVVAIRLTAWVCSRSDTACAQADVPPGTARQASEQRDVEFKTSATGGVDSDNPIVWPLTIH